MNIFVQQTNHLVGILWIDPAWVIFVLKLFIKQEIQVEHIENDVCEVSLKKYIFKNDKNWVFMLSTVSSI